MCDLRKADIVLGNVKIDQNLLFGLLPKERIDNRAFGHVAAFALRRHTDECAFQLFEFSEFWPYAR